MKRIISLIAASLLFSTAAFSQEFMSDSLSDAYLHKKINDYFMIGFNGGVTFSRMQFNPSLKQDWLYTPRQFSVMVSKHTKLFDYWPLFAITTGLEYGSSGYRLKEDPKKHTITSYDGETMARFEVFEIPLLAELHIDRDRMRYMFDFGFYGGYRKSVYREGIYLSQEMRNSFRDVDRRWDYGLEGGLGLGYILSPIEIHLKAGLRYSWGALTDPDYHSPYYYRFAYPLDVFCTAGIYFHLSKRAGYTHTELRRMARESVYGE